MSKEERYRCCYVARDTSRQYRTFKITTRAIWTGVFSSFISRSRGVAVLIRKNIPLIISVKDLKGRYVIIRGPFCQNNVMMNVYFAPAHPTTFFTKIFLDLVPFLSNPTVIIGGDFNLILNPLSDRFPHSTAPPSPQAIMLHAL